MSEPYVPAQVTRLEDSMTTPNDAPRPTSELVKEIHGFIVKMKNINEVMTGNADEGSPYLVMLENAAASLQSLEARNKELEEIAEALHANFADSFDPLLKALANRAALHPATKTGET